MYPDQLIADIQQNFDQVLTSKDRNLPYQVVDLLVWLAGDPRTTYYFAALTDSFLSFQKQILEQEGKLIDQFKSLIEDVLVEYPALDDRMAPATPMPMLQESPATMWSLLEGTTPPLRNLKRINKVGHLLEAHQVWDGFVRQHMRTPDRKEWQDRAEPFVLRGKNLGNAIEKLHHQAQKFERTHPIVAFFHLNSIYTDLFGAPLVFENLHQALQVQLSSEYSRQHLVQQLVDGEGELSQEEKELCQKIREHLEDFKRFFLHKAKTSVTLQGLFHRYKVRAAWYDKMRLRKMAEYEGDDEKRQVEDRLVEDLALYLFDHGYPVLMKTNQKNLQPDLLQMIRQHAFVVEGKVYKESDRDMLKNGFNQLYEYLLNHDLQDPKIREGFFVVYRLGGPLTPFLNGSPLGVTPSTRFWWIWDWPETAAGKWGNPRHRSRWKNFREQFSLHRNPDLLMFSGASSDQVQT